MFTTLSNKQLELFYKKVRKLFLLTNAGTKEETTMSNILLVTCRAIDKRDIKNNIITLYKASL